MWKLREDPVSPLHPTALGGQCALSLPWALGVPGAHSGGTSTPTLAAAGHTCPVASKYLLRAHLDPRANRARTREAASPSARGCHWRTPTGSCS